ncbi:phospholipase SGR2-like [Nicotiana tomentosiformis]|uniref:phospholipase SGR2-like n=1 Tax=Nicotiana tomentosiformis TaxID=4098 RepID=UPI0008783F2D
MDWLPLREDVAEQLEFAYRSKGLHAIFTGEDDTWEAWLNADVSGFSSAMGFGVNGVKLRRGYAPPQSSKPTQALIYTLSSLLLLVLFVLISSLPMLVSFVTYDLLVLSLIASCLF